MRDLTTLPHWDRRDEVKRWTVAQLDKERSSRSPRPVPSITRHLAMIAAEAGNMRPLRALHPELASYLQPNRRGQRGKYKRKRHAGPWALQMAVEDVARIRKLWKLCLGHWKRSDSLAEEIAAERWKIDLRELRSARLQVSRSIKRL